MVAQRNDITHALALVDPSGNVMGTVGEAVPFGEIADPIPVGPAGVSVGPTLVVAGTARLRSYTWTARDRHWLVRGEKHRVVGRNAAAAVTPGQGVWIAMPGAARRRLRRAVRGAGNGADAGDVRDGHYDLLRGSHVPRRSRRAGGAGGALSGRLGTGRGFCGQPGGGAPTRRTCRRTMTGIGAIRAAGTPRPTVAGCRPTVTAGGLVRPRR